MDWINILLKVVLFIGVVPGVLFRLTPTSSLVKQSILHGILFASLNYYVSMYIHPMLERFDNPDTKVIPPCPPGSVRHGKDCRMKGEGEAY